MQNPIIKYMYKDFYSSILFSSYMLVIVFFSFYQLSEDRGQTWRALAFFSYICLHIAFIVNSKPLLLRICGIITMATILIPAIGMMFIFPAIVLLSIYMTYISLCASKLTTITKHVIGGYTVLLLYRIAAVIIALLMLTCRQPPADLKQLSYRLGVLHIACGPDGGVFEFAIRHNIHKVEAQLERAKKDTALINAINSSKESSGETNKYEDIYAESGYIRWLKKDNEILIYSVGPDSKDDKCKIRYDSKRGFGSQGDIICRLDSNDGYNSI